MSSLPDCPKEIENPIDKNVSIETMTLLHSE